MKEFFNNLTLPKAISLICLLILVTVIIIFILMKISSPRKGQKADRTLNRKKMVNEPQPVVEEPQPQPEVKVEQAESEGTYVSPLILDRAKYEYALQEKLERERQEQLDRQAMETARLEMLKNKEFQSHAGYIGTLQRFSKKDQLENQLANEGKVDKELLNTYLNEKSTSIGEEFSNMSPELKAVILSDLMKRKY